MRERAAVEGVMVKGRQMLRLICDHYRVGVAEGALLGIQGLTQVKPRSDDLTGKFRLYH